MIKTCHWCGGPADTESTCPKSIECPSCGAGPGESCHRPSGHRAATMHARRWQLAEGGFGYLLPAPDPFGQPELF